MDMPAQRKVEALAMQRGQTKLSGPRPDSSRLEDPWVRKPSIIISNLETQKVKRQDLIIDPKMGAVSSFLP